MDFSFQLYSARNIRSWPDALAMLAAAGYKYVEGFGSVYEDPAAFRRLLDRNSLTMPSGHFSIDALEDEPDAVIVTAAALGIKRIYCPHLAVEDRPSDRSGWNAFGARLGVVGERIRAAGLSFGWHNHDFEFAPLGDGTVPMQILLDAAPEIEWEADIAWIVRSGADPFDWIARHGGRMTAVHVKDIAPSGEAVNEDGWADVGHGTVDWTGLLEELRARTPARLLVMEHDNPADAERFATRSMDWLRGATEKLA